MERLIDADEAYKVLTDYYNHRTEIQHKALKEALSKVPTVDAVEVIRCKDCIHCTYDNRQLLYLCDYTPFDDYIQVAPLDYCSWGAKMDEVKDGKTY